MVCVIYSSLKPSCHTDSGDAFPSFCWAHSAFVALFGYSINTLTLFAMVLAIGLLVDDAIVVVENVNRLCVNRGFPRVKPRKNQWARFLAHWLIALVLSHIACALFRCWG
ncbi:efflux RND transporter permease subunit [Escherichia coli]